MGRRSSLHEHFVRVKTRMGLERFEVGSSFRPIFKSVYINVGIGFEAKLTFAVFCSPGIDLYQNLAQYD